MKSVNPYLNFNGNTEEAFGEGGADIESELRAVWEICFPRPYLDCEILLRLVVAVVRCTR